MLRDFEPSEEQLHILSYTGSIHTHTGLLRSGKTTAGCYAAACHATGVYPLWWRGVRFDAPTSILVSGKTSVLLRDTLQTKLLGDAGFITAELLVPNSTVPRPGLPGAVYSVRVKHTSGGESTIRFTSFDSPSHKLQELSFDFVLFDGKPDAEFDAEAKMHTKSSGSMLYLRWHR